MQKHDNARKFLEIPLIAFMLKLTILETFYIELGLNYQNEIIFFLWNLKRRCISIVIFFLFSNIQLTWLLWIFSQKFSRDKLFHGRRLTIHPQLSWLDGKNPVRIKQMGLSQK